MPKNLPNWTYLSSEFSDNVKEKGKAKEEPKRKVVKELIRDKPKRKRFTDYEQLVLYKEEEEYRTDESARISIIQGTLEQLKKLILEEEYIESDNKFDKE